MCDDNLIEIEIESQGEVKDVNNYNEVVIILQWEAARNFLILLFVTNYFGNAQGSADSLLFGFYLTESITLRASTILGRKYPFSRVSILIMRDLLEGAWIK